MPKITLIGAGSTVFAKNLLGDILSFPELSDSTIYLFDIDAERLRTSEIVAHKVAQTLDAHPTIVATTDRHAAFDSADYAICMIQVGGYQPSTVIDFEIPRKYGLRQTIADTLGIGGIMRSLRTIPVLLEMCEDMEELCPDVTFLNYVNPMAMNCWAISRASTIKTVGLCHSVQGTAGQLARDIDIPIEEINYVCAGINHMAFYLQFERNGEDLYLRIRQVLEEERVPDTNRVRYEMFKRLGYFVTESSEHFSEYVPWFIKRDRPDLIDRFNVPLDEYMRRCEVQITAWGFMQQKLENPEADLADAFAQAMRNAGVSEEHLPLVVHNFENLNEVKRSSEYGSLIIHSLETGEPRVVYGNVANDALIDNLPQGCCVEVPCLVDKNGVQPTRIGQLPPHLAALMQTNINVQSLTVEAALTKRREYIYHAAMLDPHTAAELDLDQIWSLVDDLIEAHGEYLPRYQ
ncbi:MAG: alpha-glucosidase/alpha-galactosidase [Chloroflexi bacterium AL-W]|nr:alpha-glucosidase/alpha-galactosidase [Chloroflexi bacterium AL-N1]NOK65565.1 alpha-glucosidase/alpha-galactosidase [Chloroflexi bacterium AL-N10]NOK74494.1 alpha-glucosidase/alpha-galactosidase [Chloroflexi bacterium AL-N5]NOK80598.1 alpha-glucosidase/alpha-galactosidase [Chloroflexi bacterium AL-W]NOK88752.1 alpha-glucosidase/alpha-galactosidase [Chloroflexi bacterium AL-N15]